MKDHYSYSSVELYKRCPYAYKLRYIDELETITAPEATDARVIGTAVHNALEKDLAYAESLYMDNFCINTNASEEELLKLEHIFPVALNFVHERLKLDDAAAVTYEYELSYEGFLGYIDLLVKRWDGSFEIYDFKYSNHASKYEESAQLHVYKYFFEKTNPTAKVAKIGYIIIPKILYRQKKTEGVKEFRERLARGADSSEPTLLEVLYNETKVKEFIAAKEAADAAQEFNKSEGLLCNFCDYQGYCQKGDDYMILPQNTRRPINHAANKKIWLYGMPFSGKSTLADQFPDPIFLNTDGNTNSFSAPYILIKDQLEGPVVTTGGWAVFKDAVDTLASGGHPYKTIVVDLLEDCYEYCRQYTYSRLGIAHESEKPFQAWDMVRSNFLNELKRLTTLNLNVVLISHEDRSRDLTKRNGDKVSTISPNLAEKVANKVAGMVDLVMRVTCEDDHRFINLKADTTTFGGGRLSVIYERLPCTMESVNLIYGDGDVDFEIPQIKKTKASNDMPQFD